MKHSNLIAPAIFALMSLFQFSVHAGCGNQLVLDPIAGLYEKLPVSVEIPIGKLRLSTSSLDVSAKSKLIGMLSVLLDEEGAAIAAAERHFSPDRKSILLAHVSTLDRLTMKRLAPKFLDIPGSIPLVAGRGTPTSVLLTLIQMRLAGISYGELRRLYVADVTNAVTLLELRNRPAIADWMNAHPNRFPPGKLIAAEVMTTNTGRYIQTVLTQAGSRITNVDIEHAEHLVYAAELLHLRRHDANAVRARGQLSPMAKVPAHFHIVIRVEPI